MKRLTHTLLCGFLLATGASAEESSLSPKVLALCEVPDEKLGASIVQVEAALGQALSIEESAHTNPYDERVKDRRLTLNYPKTKVTLYVAMLMGRQYLEKVVTTEDLPLFSGTVQIGMGTESLKKALGAPTAEKDTQLAYWCDDEYGMGFVFDLREGKLSSLTWHGGMD